MSTKQQKQARRFSRALKNQNMAEKLYNSRFFRRFSQAWLAQKGFDLTKNNEDGAFYAVQWASVGESEKVTYHLGEIR